MKYLTRIGSYTIVAVLVSAVLVGCGRRGPPIAPSNVPLSEEEKKAGVERKKKVPDKRFILDGLLE